MTSRCARVMRAALAAGFSTFVAVLSHTLAAAEAPGTLAVVLSVVFSLLVCLALTGRSLSLGRLAVAVVVSQVIYHGLFTLFGTPAPATAFGRAGGLFGPHDHAAMMAQIQALSSGTGSTTELVATGWMLAAHALGAIVTIAALRRAESTFWGLVEGSRLHLRALFTATVQPVVVGAPRVRPMLGSHVIGWRSLELLISSMRHRGPPQALAG